MSSLGEANEEKNIQFSWGYKRGVGGPNKDVQFYESFTYDDIKYHLFDCVYLWRDNQMEPDIGKLVNIWETPSHKKKVKVVWFFWPTEIQNWLGSVMPLENEIFLASGEGQGLFNVNPLEAISGKCDVICTSKDKRNPQASEEELRMADYIFYRTFDVGECKISFKFADKIAGTEVEHFFNGKKNQKLISHAKATLKERAPISNFPHEFELVTSVRDVKDVSAELNIPAAPILAKKECFADKNTAKRPKTFVDKDRTPAAKISCSRLENRVKEISEDPPTRSATDLWLPNKGKLQDTLGLPPSKEKFVGANDSVSKKRLPKAGDVHEMANKVPKKGAGQFEKDKGVKTDCQIVEVTRRPDVDTSKWFKQESWEERMQRAQEKGTLVLLENLDPSYTSSEVEDIVWHALKEKVCAKMIQRSSFSRPHYGQAFVIFKSKDAAELAISELNKKCLMLGDGRPLIARRRTLSEPGYPNRFVGHLVIDKLKFRRQHEDIRNAVSTSHYSQPNTLEYNMAMEWCCLQEKSNLWWGTLHKQQAKEMKDIMSKLKIPHNV